MQAVPVYFFERLLIFEPAKLAPYLESPLPAKESIVACDELNALVAELERGAGVVILAERSIDENLLDRTRSFLRSQPSWSDLPFIVIKTVATLSTMAEKLEDIANVTFLQAPISPATFTSSVRSTLRARKRQLEIRDHDRRKDEFLAMLGHELRNPLAAIQSALRVLEHARSSAEREDRQRKIIARQTQHLMRIVDDLLDVSRVTMGKISLESDIIDLRTVGQRWLQAFGVSELVRNHRVTLSLPDAPVYVKGDSVRLEQILCNLLNNALKYTPKGGRVEVRVSGDVEEATIRVSDSGIGIEPHMLSKIFEMFTQEEHSLARSQGGLGLGLALVKHLVLMHGGTVVAHSEGINRGADFVVRLPRLQNPECTPPTTDVSRGATEKSVSLSLLVIEDNDDGREALQAVLEIWGHEVETAVDGEAGFQQLLNKRFDAALIDIGLPKVDGYEIARRCCLGSRAADRPTLIAMTGYGQPEDRRRAFEAGFDAYLVKPISTDALRSLLAELPPRPSLDQALVPPGSPRAPKYLFR